MMNSIANSRKPLSQINFLQINLKHSKIASENLIAYIIENKMMISLIQEPWVNKQKVMGLNHHDYHLFYRKPDDGVTPRSCIRAHKSLTAFLTS